MTPKQVDEAVELLKRREKLSNATLTVYFNGLPEGMTDNLCLKMQQAWIAIRNRHIDEVLDELKALGVEDSE